MVHEHEYLLNCSAGRKKKKKKKPRGSKRQNPRAVYASLSLITEAIPLELIQILKSFPQSLDGAISSFSMAL